MRILSLLPLLIPDSASADEPTTVALEWSRESGADECIDAATLEELIEARLGWDAFEVGASRVVVGKVKRTRGGYVAELHLETSGTRTAARSIETEQDDCRALDGPLVLALALVIDPTASLSPPSGPSTAAFPDATDSKREESPPPPLAVWPACPASPPPPPGAPGATHPVAITVRGLNSIGLLPDRAFGVALHVNPELGARWSVDLGMRFLPSARVADRYEFSFTGASALACHRLLAPLDVCAGAMGGAVNATVLSGSVGEAGQQPWVAVEAGPRASGTFGVLRWEVGTMAALPFVRPDFNSQTSILPEAPLSVSTFLGLGASIP